MARKKKSRFTIRKRISEVPMSKEEFDEVEDRFIRMIAHAYLKHGPNFFEESEPSSRASDESSKKPEADLPGS